MTTTVHLITSRAFRQAKSTTKASDRNLAAEAMAARPKPIAQEPPEFTLYSPWHAGEAHAPAATGDGGGGGRPIAIAPHSPCEERLNAGLGSAEDEGVTSWAPS